MSLRDKDREKISCYEKAEGIPALQVELENGESFIFPYIHLQFANLRVEDGDQLLEIQYSSHQVRITGTGFLTLLEAVQKTELSVIKVSLEKATKGSTCRIGSITVESSEETPESETEEVDGI